MTTDLSEVPDASPAPAAPTAPAAPDRVIDGRVGLVLLACTALYCVFIWRPSFVFRGQRYFTLFDDAMISMTYARNLADGHGLVWNAGAPAVEGYTNPLWTLLMAGVHRLGVGEAAVPLVISVISAALLIGCAVLAAHLAHRIAPTARFAPVLAALFVGVYYPLVYWSLRGMEVGLVTFLVLAGVLLAVRLHEEWTVRDLLLLVVVLAAGLLTRDDFVVPGAVMGLWLLVVLRGRARLVTGGVLMAGAAATVGAQLAFRLSYYGEPLPNTYYLKVANQPVGPRLWRGLLSLVVVALADLLVLIGVTTAGLRARARASATIWLLLSLATALALYSVYVGGDAWEWARLANRYITPAVVLLLVLAACVIEPLAVRVRKAVRPRFVLAAIVVLALSFAFVDSWLGVLFHGVLGDHLGGTPTDSVRAAVAGLVVLIALVVAAVLGGRRRLPPRLARQPVLVAILAVVVLASVTFSAWTSWVGDGGFYTARNQGATAYGLVLRDLTEPGATIAVIWAGAPIYYAHRGGVDLLGKMDPVIAHGPHHEGVPMYPGHDKFDFGHSISNLRPDLIAQYAWFTAADIDRFVADGYRPMRFRPGVADELQALDVPRALLWVREDSDLVHRDLLEPIPIDEAKGRSVEPSLAH